MNPKKAGYRKGTHAVAGDVGRIAANVFWGAVLGGTAGALAARSWRGAIIGMLATSAITVGVMGSRATTEGRWAGTALAVGAAAGALGLSFGALSPTPAVDPTAQLVAPQTAGLGAGRILVGVGARRVYGHPLAMRSGS
jgi:hypothetical protein